MNIPNILTTIRLLLIPVFAYLVVGTQNYPLAAVIFIFSGITDILDGWIARKFNMITDFGKLYDPVADKLMQIAAAICLYIQDILPVWIIIFIAAKELSMMIVSLILYYKKIVVHSYWYGKAATVILYASIFLLLITKNINSGLSFFMLCIVVLSALFSAFGYLFDFVIKNEIRKRN